MQNRGWSPVGWGVLPRARAGSAPAIPDAANLRGYMEGDNLDGANNSTLINGLPVASVVNLGTLGGTFDQLTALNMPLFSTTAGPGGTKPALTFDGSDWLVSSLPASAWAFMHDGTGCTVYAVVRQNATGTRVIVATNTGTAADTGYTMRTNTFAQAWVTATGAAQIVAGVASVLGNFNSISTRLLDGGSPEFELMVNGVSLATMTVNVVATPSAQTLTIGATPAGAQLFSGAMRRIVIFSSYHDATMQAAVLAWSQTLDAVTYPAP